MSLPKLKQYRLNPTSMRSLAILSPGCDVTMVTTYSSVSNKSRFFLTANCNFTNQSGLFPSLGATWSCRTPVPLSSEKLLHL